MRDEKPPNCKVKNRMTLRDGVTFQSLSLSLSLSLSGGNGDDGGGDSAFFCIYLTYSSCYTCPYITSVAFATPVFLSHMFILTPSTPHVPPPTPTSPTLVHHTINSPTSTCQSLSRNIILCIINNNHINTEREKSLATRKSLS